MRRLLSTLALAAALLAAPSSASAQARVDRLERLAAFLETVPDARFNMQAWAIGQDPADPSYASCAAGHATRVPEFASAGFRLRLRGTTGIWIVSCEGMEGLPACCRFFGLTMDQAVDLFSVHATKSRGRLEEVRLIRGLAARERDQFTLMLLSSL